MRPRSFNPKHIASRCEIVRHLVLSNVPRQIGHEDSPATCTKRGVSWSFNMWQRQYKQRCKTTPGERLRGASTGGPVADDGSPADGVQMYKHTMQHVIGNDEAVHLQVPAFRGYVSPQASGLQAWKGSMFNLRFAGSLRQRFSNMYEAAKKSSNNRSKLETASLPTN